MITPQHINEWIEDPKRIKDIPADTFKQLIEQYPYFNIGLILATLKSAGQLDAIQLITNINPVYKAILTAQYNDKYQPLHVETTTALDIEEISETTIIDTDSEEIIVEEETKSTLDQLYKTEAPVVDYFSNEGITINNDMPEDISSLKAEPLSFEGKLNWTDENKPMVVMSFTEWLNYISKKQAKERADEESKSALKALWQKEKLAQAIEEESEEIPEEVFEMAVNSIVQQDEIISEAMADIYARQNKIEKAIDMYKKLSLQHPEKNAYFAEKIASLQKDI